MGLRLGERRRAGAAASKSHGLFGGLVGIVRVLCTSCSQHWSFSYERQEKSPLISRYNYNCNMKENVGCCECLQNGFTQIGVDWKGALGSVSWRNERLSRDLEGLLKFRSDWSMVLVSGRGNSLGKASRQEGGWLSERVEALAWERKSWLGKTLPKVLKNYFTCWMFLNIELYLAPHCS